MTLTEYSVESVIGGNTISLSTGKFARQANGSVILKCGNTILLTTATMSKAARVGADFLPLTIEFSEKMYSSGKIPGGFFKREARPSTDATLIARLIDRPLRPSFPKNFHHDVQIIITVLSYDESVCLEPLCITAASAALSISDIPFNGPIAGSLIGKQGESFLQNPSKQELQESELDLIVAGNKEAVLMVEAGAKEVSEETIISGIMEGHTLIKEFITLQESLVSKFSKPKITVEDKPAAYDEYKEKITTFLGNKIETVLSGDNSKQDVEEGLGKIQEEIINEFIDEEETDKHLIMGAFNEIKKAQIRHTIISKKIRVDGRKTNEIRPISIDTSFLPNAHGSSLFTRGETQSLGVVTLGSSDDELMIDGLDEKKTKHYYFHYNFPPFSVGETGFLRTGRREIGHGALAERALQPILPSQETFPYTIRLVSEILESNGSSSMASVCSGSLAMMDCGIPTKAPVSGIAMGLLMDGNDYIILSDIQGLEDHYGDMDFKVAGTKDGITALQLDIKISGLSKEILTNALTQAKEGRFHILNEMNQVISISRETLSANAPKLHSFRVNPDKVGAIIGPGGKMIRKIEEESKASVIIKDGNDGEVCISAKNQDALDIALTMIEGLTKEPKVGEIFDGKVTKTVAFGAFIELLPGKEGLLHISKIAKERVENVEDFMKVGDEIKVKIEKVDAQNKISLTRA